MPTRLPSGAWVLIADSEKALFLVNEGDARNPDLQLVGKEEQENPPNREQAANRRGRVHQRVGEGRSAYGDTDWHSLAKERFASELGDILYKHAHKDEFSRPIDAGEQMVPLICTVGSSGIPTFRVSRPGV